MNLKLPIKDYSSGKLNSQLSVLFQKQYHQGALHGMVSSGGVIPLCNGLFGLRLKPLGDGFVGIEFITYGLDNPVYYQYNKKPKESVKVEVKHKLISSLSDEII